MTDKIQPEHVVECLRAVEAATRRLNEKHAKADSSAYAFVAQIIVLIIFGAVAFRCSGQSTLMGAGDCRNLCLPREAQQLSRDACVCR